MNSLRDRITDFLNNRPIGTVCLALAVASLFILAQPGYRLLKNWRSNQLLAESIELQTEESHRQAFYKAHAAVLLNRGNIEAARNLATLALNYNHPQAHRFWETVIQNEASTTSDWAFAIDASLRNADYESAFSYLLRWKMEGVDEPVAYLLRRAQAFALSGQYQTAAELTSQSLKDHPNDQQLKALYFYIINSVGSIETRVELANSILNSDSNTPSDLYWIAHQNGMPQDLRIQALEALFTLEDLPLIETLEVINLAASLNWAGTANALAQIQQTIDLQDVKQVEQYTTVLCNLGDYEKVVSLLDTERAQSSRILLRNLLIAQIDQGIVAEALDITSQQRSERLTSLAEETLIRAFAFQQTGDTAQYQTNLQEAINSAEYDDLVFLEQQFIRLGETQSLINLYKRVSLHPLLGHKARYKWLELAQQTRSEPEIEKALAGPKGWSNQLSDPRQQANVVYLQLVYKIDLESTRQSSQELAAKFSGDPFFRHLLGLAYLQFGNRDLAKQVVTAELPAQDNRSALINAAIYQTHFDKQRSNYLPQELALVN